MNGRRSRPALASENLAARVFDRGTSISLLREVRFPHSLGMLYSTFTAYLGFAVNEDEYKVMGLAAYGRPTMVDQVRKVIRRTPDGAFAIVPEYFEYQTTATRSYSSKFVELFGPPRPSYEPIDVETAEGRRFADIAASVQRVLEDTLVDIARALQQETKLADLCFGGGVALNGVANARILAESGFERVFVPPAPGDGGCALGAALYADRLYFKNADRDVPDHPFWGPAVDAAHLARAAREDDQHVDELDEGSLLGMPEPWGKPPVSPARIAPDGAAHESLVPATSESPGTSFSTISRTSGGSLSLRNSSTLGRNALS